MEETLMQYIATERSRGVADAEIKKALLEKGWDAGKVGAAFGENIVHATPAAVQKGLFVGRISRKEYFFASLLMLGIGFVAFLLFFLFVLSDATAYGGLRVSSGEADKHMPLVIPLFLIIGLAAFVLGLSLMVRRLHDLGKEWFWVFLTFIPVVTFFFSLYLLFFKGEQRANLYGPVPNNSRSIFDVLLAR